MVTAQTAAPVPAPISAPLVPRLTAPSPHPARVNKDEKAASPDRKRRDMAAFCAGSTISATG